MPPKCALDLSNLTVVAYSHVTFRGIIGDAVLATPLRLLPPLHPPLGDPNDGKLLKTKQSLACLLVLQRGPSLLLAEVLAILPNEWYTKNRYN